MQKRKRLIQHNLDQQPLFGEHRPRIRREVRPAAVAKGAGLFVKRDIAGGAPIELALHLRPLVADGAFALLHRDLTVVAIVTNHLIHLPLLTAMISYIRSHKTDYPAKHPRRLRRGEPIGFNRVLPTTLPYQTDSFNLESWNSSFSAVARPRHIRTCSPHKSDGTDFSQHITGNGGEEIGARRGENLGYNVQRRPVRSRQRPPRRAGARRAAVGISAGPPAPTEGIVKTHPPRKEDADGHRLFSGALPAAVAGRR